MVKLSQQAIVVAFAVVLSVLTSTYKFHMLDSVILALTGALAVYNVNCLTSGNCNAWATLVAVSFFITTLLQFKNYEGQDGVDYSKDIDISDYVEEINMVNNLPEINIIKNLPGLDIIQSIALSPPTGFDVIESFQYISNIVNAFSNTTKVIDAETVINDLIFKGDVTVFYEVINNFIDILTNVTSLPSKVLTIAQDVLNALIDFAKGRCQYLKDEEIKKIKALIAKVKIWEEIESKFLNIKRTADEIDLSTGDEPLSTKIENILNEVWDGVTDPTADN
jgi:hypothetical protein